MMFCCGAVDELAAFGGMVPLAESRIWCGRKSSYIYRTTGLPAQKFLKVDERTNVSSPSGGMSSPIPDFLKLRQTSKRLKVMHMHQKEGGRLRGSLLGHADEELRAERLELSLTFLGSGNEAIVNRSETSRLKRCMC